jgi:TonB family protein
MGELFSQISYPKEAREKTIEGIVYVKFTIEKDGSVTHPEIIRSVGGGCDEEVLRVIGLMPPWSPGRKDGQAVATSFTLPVKFKLDAVEQKAEVLEVYPNPAGDSGFNVKFKAPAGAVSILVYDANKKGDPVEKSIMNYDGSEQTVHFNTKGLFANGGSKGNLVVTLIGEKQTVLGSRVVVVQ